MALLATGCDSGSKSKTSDNFVKPDTRYTSNSDTPGTQPTGESNSNPGSGTTPGSEPDPSKPAPIDPNRPDGRPIDRKPAKFTPPPNRADNQTIPKPKTNQWVKTTLTASQLAKNVGSKMASLNQTHGEARLSAKTPEGSGEINAPYDFAGEGKFRIVYLQPKAMLEAGLVVGDGKVKTVLLDNKYAQPVPTQKPDVTSATLKAKLLQEWPIQFSRAMFMGTTDKWDPWLPLIQQLADPKSGYSMFIEERVMDFEGQKIKNYRLLAVRKPEVAKKAGKSEIEMVFDAHHWLPVTIRTNTTSVNGKQWNQMWTVAWEFGKKPDESLFVVTK